MDRVRYGLGSAFRRELTEDGHASEHYRTGIPSLHLLLTPQHCEQIVGRLDIAEGHQKLAQRVIVQRIRLVGVTVGDHDSAVAPHGGVTCSRLATRAGGNAGEEQRVDAYLMQHAIEFRGVGNERRVAVLDSDFVLRQGYSFFDGLVALERGVGVVTAGPGQLGTVASVAAKGSSSKRAVARP